MNDGEEITLLNRSITVRLLFGNFKLRKANFIHNSCTISRKYIYLYYLLVLSIIIYPRKYSLMIQYFITWNNSCLCLSYIIFQVCFAIRIEKYGKVVMNIECTLLERIHYIYIKRKEDTRFNSIVIFLEKKLCQNLVKAHYETFGFK